MSLSSASAGRRLASNAFRLASSSPASFTPSTPIRTFHNSTHKLAARPTRVKAARPEVFNWRRLDSGLPIPRVPQVDYTRDLNEAEELLDSLRASRLSLHVASKASERYDRDGGSIWSAGEVSVLSIADMEGVVGELFLSADAEHFVNLSHRLVVLHLSHMKSIPPRLRAILEDPQIVKQAFGAIGYVRDFDKDPKLFDNVQAASMLDLRELGSLLFPRLRQPDLESVPHSAFRRTASELLLGQGHSTPGSGHNFDVAKLAGNSLDYIINATWLTQQLSVKFLDQLDEIEAEATESMGIRAAAEVVEAALERASYSTAEHRSLKARYG